VDGVGGGLEHLNSTTIGMRAATIARDPLADVDVSAHEYFHHWNVKRIRPVALGPFDYQRITRTRSLWLSEGVTDYYAGVLLRRAGVVTEDDARAALASSIQSYLANPASTWLSPERSSLTAWDPPAVNRGYSLSYYLSGALLGEVLDVELRAHNPNGDGMDDLMRRLRDRYASTRGFTDGEVVSLASSVCRCDMTPFFVHYVSGGTTLPLERFAHTLGWNLIVERGPAVDSSGRALPDRRVSITGYGGLGSAGGAVGGALKLAVTDPASAWGRAGLATGDTVLAVNDSIVRSPADFQRAIATLEMGDTVTVRVRRGAVPRTVRVIISGYDRVRARLEPMPHPSAEQLRARERWMHGSNAATTR
jgi:predicted metalloprotease with PDZ domain